MRLSVPRRILCVVVGLLVISSLSVQASQSGDIEKLLSSGWKLAGFASAGTNRYALILFKHPDKNYLVQCLTGYDVTRKKREVTTCYEIR